MSMGMGVEKIPQGARQPMPPSIDQDMTDNMRKSAEYNTKAVSLLHEGDIPNLFKMWEENEGKSLGLDSADVDKTYGFINSGDLKNQFPSADSIDQAKKLYDMTGVEWGSTKYWSENLEEGGRMSNLKSRIESINQQLKQ